MSGRKAKLARRARRQITAEDFRIAAKSLAARKFIEVRGDIDDPDAVLAMKMNTPEEALAIALADPNVYRTPAGNLISLVGSDGVDHWMSPAEAEAWQVDAAAVDRQYPEGTQARSVPGTPFGWGVRT